MTIKYYNFYNLSQVKIEEPPASSIEAYKQGLRRRSAAIRALDKRLEYLEKRRDEQGIDNPYISAEITGTKWALSLMSHEWITYRDSCKASSTVSSQPSSTPPLSSPDSDLVSLANDSAED